MIALTIHAHDNVRLGGRPLRVSSGNYSPGAANVAFRPTAVVQINYSLGFDSIRLRAKNRKKIHIHIALIDATSAIAITPPIAKSKVCTLLSFNW